MAQRGSFLSSIPPVTKNLIIINVLMWLSTIVFRNAGIVDLDQYLALHHYKASNFGVWQLFTYMFMHDTSSGYMGFAHIFFNMFNLWMFGGLIERRLTNKRYLFYYLTCGIGAALAQLIVWHFELAPVVAAEEAGQMVVDTSGALIKLNDFMTVGASGAVFGILLAFGMLFPNLKMYVIPFPFPVKAKWMVLGYGVIEFIFGVSGTMSGVAHFAHLGGMVAGIVLLLYWKRKGTLGGYGYY